MKMPTVMKREFSKTPSINIERSKFDRSHGIKTTFDAGDLIPIFWDEVLPGDTFNLRLSSFARLATPLKPIMDNMYMDTFFFFVPNRIIWDNWEKFNGAQDDPGDSTAFVTPKISLVPDNNNGGIPFDSLGAYFGWPMGSLGVDLTTRIEDAVAFYHRAYYLIWNEWFRDQNMQDSLLVPKGDGPDEFSTYVIQKRGKRHDYFTSCLPFPQKGADVTLPLGTTAPVNLGAPGISSIIRISGTHLIPPAETLQSKAASGLLTNLTSGQNLVLDPNGSLETDLSSATAASINSIREALQLQVFFERDARGGTRYIEILKSHFGVTSPDARLQRPEYLGGGSSNMNIHPVPQTSVAAGTPQGNLAGFGTASFSGHGFNKSFVEHGVLIGLVSVRADLTYQQGLNRMWKRDIREDYYWPAFAHLGEQAVLNQEIYADLNEGTGPTEQGGIFGYQERYAEYRYKPSVITGIFNANAPVPIDFWHLSQEFATQPTLDSAFITENPPLDRVIAVPSEPHILFDGYFDLMCARPMPVYSVPTVGDRL